MKDRLVMKRFINIFLMLLITMGFTTILCLSQEMWPDEIILFYVLAAAFYALFVFLLEHGRARKRIAGDRSTDFGKITIGYAISAGVTLLGMFLPEFLKPVLFVCMIMVGFSSIEIALCTGIFFDVILCLGLGLSLQEYLMYSLLTVFGCIVAEAMEDKRFTFWYNMIILSLSVLLPGIFYYFTYQEVRLTLFLYGAIEGIIIDYIVLLSQKKIVAYRKKELDNKYRDILDEDYPLARELSAFSNAEYEHARRVSSVAAHCAKATGIEERICAAAGFYYRIGVIEGETIAESGIQIAERACFPEDVIRIISEYNGELQLPSTPESAVVHMVDGLIKKLEALKDQTTMSSGWNQDMVIYQTLNEFSASGIYDLSGLSMNRFLTIRELLVKEENIV